jgi:hypothetical protein
MVGEVKLDLLENLGAIDIILYSWRLFVNDFVT